MRALALLTLPMLLAGCTGTACNAPFDPTEINGPSQGGDGPRSLEIHLHGFEASQAGVVVFWVAGQEPGEPLPDHVDLRTVRLQAQDGRVVAHVPDDRTMNVYAAAPGTTKEWLLEVPMDVASVDLWLYPEVLRLEAEGSIDEPATIGYPDVRWWPTVAIDSQTYGPDATARVQEATVTVRWTNQATGSADLGVGGGAQSLDYYWNSGYQTSLGAHAETFWFDRDLWTGQGWHRAGTVQFGPTISTGQFAAQPVPYAIELTAQLAETETLPALCATLEGLEVAVDEAPPDGGEGAALGDFFPFLLLLIIGGAIVALALGLRKGRT